MLTAIVAGMGWLIAGSGPEWARWTAAVIMAGMGTVAALVVLLGPVARRMAGERRPLTGRDLDQLTAKDRIDAINNARGTLLQAATGLVVVAGLIFTGAGLVYTARTLEVSARSLDATREGQITDRYTKAVEQLGSPKIDVRLGGVYALERLAKDSQRDRSTITQVLVSYVRVHAHLSKGQPLEDVAAAINVVSDLSTDKALFRKVDLSEVDFRGLDLSHTALRGVDLIDADLSETDLSGTDLTEADMLDANLSGADLTGAVLGSVAMSDANLSGAVLSHAVLRSVDLRRAVLYDAVLSGAILSDVDLSGADLRRANLSGANLYGAVLTGADLTGSDLTDANLRGAGLKGADLRGADLRHVKGMTSEQIKAVARTDATTTF